MTSSLVGSEMCIRDSPFLYAALRPRPKAMPPSPDSLPFPSRPLDMSTVSYTHLTLPTICSV
eukprot:9467710-Prorocentrum_lima.AAC.1